MATLAHSAPKINWDDLTQSAALPLGSWLKTDPWDDHVHQLNAKVYAPLNPRDKMPLEVTPVYFRLQRYDEAQSQAASAAKANAPATQPAPKAPARTDPTTPSQGPGSQPQQSGTPNPQS